MSWGRKVFFCWNKLFWGSIHSTKQKSIKIIYMYSIRGWSDRYKQVNNFVPVIFTSLFSMGAIDRGCYYAATVNKFLFRDISHTSYSFSLLSQLAGWCSKEQLMKTIQEGRQKDCYLALEGSSVSQQYQSRAEDVREHPKEDPGCCLRPHRLHD
jgi:hypothetical protein